MVFFGGVGGVIRGGGGFGVGGCGVVFFVEFFVF